MFALFFFFEIIFSLCSKCELEVSSHISFKINVPELNLKNKALHVKKLWGPFPAVSWTRDRDAAIRIPMH